jgi:predicted membrane chloride channel (bestrophin family)
MTQKVSTIQQAQLKPYSSSLHSSFTDILCSRLKSVFYQQPLPMAYILMSSMLEYVLCNHLPLFMVNCLLRGRFQVNME